MSDVERYEAEQQALRDKHGIGVEEDEDFHVDLRSAEVNPEIFKDVEPLLFKGFVYMPATINGVRFVFKSLNQHEMETLRFMGSGLTPKELNDHYNRFLAYGVLMVDGVNALADRDETLPELSAFFHDMEDRARREVIFHLSEINRRATRAVILTEAYCMEPVSRHRWAQTRGMDLMSPSITGVPGTADLGLNWGQLAWRALNYFEDLRDQNEREWENAKFVASSMAGKGMNRVHSQDKRRRSQEHTDRQDRRDKVIRFALLNESLESGSGGNATVKVARTVKELADQLEKDLKGEKDWHDRIVDDHERRARDHRERQLQNIRQKFADHEAEFGSARVVGGTHLKGLSADEVAYRKSRQRQIAAQRLAAQQTLPELHDPKAAEFIDKWTRGGAHQEGSIQPTPLEKARALPLLPPNKDDD